MTQIKSHIFLWFNHFVYCFVDAENGAQLWWLFFSLFCASFGMYIRGFGRPI